MNRLRVRDGILLRGRCEEIDAHSPTLEGLGRCIFCTRNIKRIVGISDQVVIVVVVDGDSDSDGMMAIGGRGWTTRGGAHRVAPSTRLSLSYLCLHNHCSIESNSLWNDECRLAVRGTVLPSPSLIPTHSNDSLSPPVSQFLLLANTIASIASSPWSFTSVHYLSNFF